MGLRFVLGRAGTGKSTWCLEAIRQELQQRPVGDPLLLLVPEQSTHQMEVRLASDLGGILRAQVVSFQRLAWRVLAETGGGQRIRVNDLGKRMILRRLLLERRQDLRIFGRAANRPGMADQLMQILHEFKAYRVTPELLAAAVSGDETLDSKLHDLALLYRAYSEFLGSRFQDPADDLTCLAAKLKEAKAFFGARVWVDGFKSFTPQELSVLRNLLLVAAEVYLTLPLDPDVVSACAEGRAFPAEPGQEYMAGPWETYLSVRQLAWQDGVEIGPSVFLAETRRFRRPELVHLEKYFYVYPTVAFSLDRREASVNTASSGASETLSDRAAALRVVTAGNRYAEVEFVARELWRLVRDQGWRWSELAVVTRDLAGYSDTLAKVFSLYEIPYFLDYRRPVLNHPVVELMTAALEVAASPWAYEPLFRCLKTGFFPLSRDAIDRLENYCLTEGVSAAEWEAAEEWLLPQGRTLPRRRAGEHGVAESELAAINRSRAKVYEVLSPLIGGLRVQEGGFPEVSFVCRLLEDLLQRLNVAQQLAAWAEEAEGAAAAGLHVQMWETMRDLLAEMSVCLSGEHLPLDEIALILLSGWENATLGLIPPRIDQVLIGALERSRSPEVKALFVLGTSEGVLPPRFDDSGLVDGDERRALGELGVKLAPWGKVRALEEQFLIYTALTRASNLLIFTCPLSDDEGRALGISPVVGRLKTLFPNLAEEFFDVRDGAAELACRPVPLLQFVAGRSGSRCDAVMSAALLAAERWLEANAETASRWQWLRRASRAPNQEARLPRVLTRRLYGRRLQASVSRLEQFAACPFAHFAGFGLRLRDRRALAVTPERIGNYLHETLYAFAATVAERNLQWARLTDDDAAGLLEEVAKQTIADPAYKALVRSARSRYLAGRLQRTLLHTVAVLRALARAGSFVPVSLELRFGPGQEVPGPWVALREGDSLVLTGQIDRVDAAEIDGRMYLRVLDYKSGVTSLTLDEILYGQNLQLLVYLDAVMQNAESSSRQPSAPTWWSAIKDKVKAFAAESAASEPAAVATGERVLPAGFLYFPVVLPEVKAEEPVNPAKLVGLRHQLVRIKGYLLSDEAVLTAMERTAGEAGSSLLGMRQRFAAGRSKVLTAEEFSLLRLFLQRRLFMTGEAILAGDVTIAPYRKKDAVACRYCAYKPICRFDPSLPENRYTDLPSLSDSAALQRMAQELDRGTGTGGAMADPGKGSDPLAGEIAELSWLN